MLARGIDFVYPDRIFLLKGHMVAMRDVLSPQCEVFGLLAKRGGPGSQHQ